MEVQSLRGVCDGGRRFYWTAGVGYRQRWEQDRGQTLRYVGRLRGRQQAKARFLKKDALSRVCGWEGGVVEAGRTHEVERDAIHVSVDPLPASVNRQSSQSSAGSATPAPHRDPEGDNGSALDERYCTVPSQYREGATQVASSSIETVETC